MTLIIDAHLDVALNALTYDRDQTKSVDEIRRRERALLNRSERLWRFATKGAGVNTVALPELRKGGVHIAFVTALARTAHPTNGYEGYDTRELCCAAARGQVAYYRLLESQGHIRMLADWPSVKRHTHEWRSYDNGADLAPAPPIGFLLTMEGADPIVSPDQVREWWDLGLRSAGLAHYGKSSYAHGTGSEGGLTDLARPLLQAFQEVGMILDLTHLSDSSFWEAVELYDGPVLASHNNCRALVPGDRQFTDDQIKAVAERDGVIGAAFDAWMLQPGWVKGVYNEITATLDTVVDHIDHICNLLGNADHVGIGSDLDGGFGREQSPRDLDTVADLQKLPSLLQKRGYGPGDIDKIMQGNWLRLLERALPKGA